MAILAALVYIYILGYSFLLLIRSRYNPLLNLGLAGLIGMGITTILMFILDVVGLSLSTLNFLMAGIVVTALLSLRSLRAKTLPEQLLFFRFKLQKNHKNILAWTILIFTAFFIAGSVIKNLYWPVSAYDSVAGYDLMARAIAAENTFNVSLHKLDLAGPRGIYPPQVEGIFAFFYIMGAESAKIVNSVFFISLLIIFHQVLSRFLSPSGAALLTFFLVFTPEMFAHASLSLTNLPGAAFVCGGSLFLYLWWKEEKSSHLIISGLMFGLNVWTRSDGIGFSVAAVFIMFLITIRKKMYLPLIFHGLLSVLPFIVWQVYLKIVIHAASIERFRTYLFWDEERFSYMVKTIYLLVTSTNLYGLSFYIFAIALIANIRYLKSNWPLLATILFSFLLYTFMFYQIDPETQDSIQTMMTASYKRGLFYFIPMILFYSGITPLSRKLFAVLDREYNRFVYGESSPS